MSHPLKPCFHNVGPMTPDALILKHARTIREEEICRWNHLVIQDVHVFVAESRSDQLQQPQVIKIQNPGGDFFAQVVYMYGLFLTNRHIEHSYLV